MNTFTKHLVVVGSYVVQPFTGGYDRLYRAGRKISKNYKGRLANLEHELRNNDVA